MKTKKLIWFLALLLTLIPVSHSLVAAHDDEKEHGIGVGGNGQPNNQPLAAMGLTPCVGGMADTFPCRNVDLAAFLPLSDIGGGTGNDIWGWTDPQTGKEYALMGRSTGTSFVDVSDPTHPVYLGNLPPHSASSPWRSLKVHANHAFIVSEAVGHGMQVFDLTQLRNVTSPPVTFSETAHYSGFGRAHTLAINEETGFAYAAGSRDTCSSGLHMVNIQNPKAPAFAGCVDSDGYTHETQCVIYFGPDLSSRGREICFNANEDTLTIVDVTNKNAPVQLSRTAYANSGYTHQGWLSDDHSYFLLNDELDESRLGNNTRTYIWNVSDLKAPSVMGTYEGATKSIDHNLYIRGGYAYESNYRSGLRILNMNDVASANLSEAAFFDVYPVDDNTGFNGTWSNYPFFASGTVIVSGIEQGLFVLRPNIPSLVPIDEAQFFVRQQYLDFLNREPDAPGLDYWTREITKCGTNATCIRSRRIGVSAAFFVEQEFQRTGYFVYRFYKASYGRQPAYAEFRADWAQVPEGADVERSQQAFAEQWVQRAAFQQVYSPLLSPADFVNKLFDTAQLKPYTAERQQQIQAMTGGKTRAQVLRDVIEIAEFKTREYNPAFVRMEYFGYLRRDPDPEGEAFWLNILNNKEPNNYRGMVCAFLTSREYQQRFGSIVTRNNSSCGHSGP